MQVIEQLLFTMLLMEEQNVRVVLSVMQEVRDGEDKCQEAAP
jgi:hypothetical protein